jgi:Fic family protein
MYRFSMTPQIVRDVAWLEAAHVRLGRRGVVPRRWSGRLKRELQAGSIAASSWMEGVRVDADETRRILAGDRPVSVTPGDAALVEGYRDAVAYALAEATTPDALWSRRIVLDVHRLAMAASKKANPGAFRPGPVFVVDGAGVVIYSAPMAVLVPELVDELCQWLNTMRDVSAPVVAALVHARVAGIHPFSDGNGRTARILATFAMARGGYGVPEFASLEAWWGSHPRSYYGAFESLGADWAPDADVTRFVATHVRAQRRQVAALTERLAVERNVWVALEDIAGDTGLPRRATEALFDAFLGRAVTNRYYRGVVGASVATATNDLTTLEAAGLLAAEGEGRGRAYTGTFRLVALVASAANAPVLASPTASIDEQRAVVLGDLREQVAGKGAANTR